MKILFYGTKNYDEEFFEKLLPSYPGITIKFTEANIHEETLESLTELRTMGSVPFCARYRLIDFPLSNMVESSVTNVGVVTNANFNSLMDHVGTGKPWDLSRKTDGLHILPPYSSNSVTMWGNRIDAYALRRI